jgi:hypothetical protein
MIKHFFEAIEENIFASLAIFMFLFSIVLAAAAVLCSVSEDKYALEMAKLGCSQKVLQTVRLDSIKYWVCPNGVQEPK